MLGAVTFFITSQFNHIYYAWENCSFMYYFWVLQSFELVMQDSHPNVYSAEALYHLNIFDPFW